MIIYFFYDETSFTTSFINCFKFLIWMQTKKFDVYGMHCKSCETLIKDALEDIGVTNTTFNKDQLTIDTDLPLEKVKQTIKDEGYEVN